MNMPSVVLDSAVHLYPSSTAVVLKAHTTLPRYLTFT
jgi:hypothetical protein